MIALTTCRGRLPWLRRALPTWLDVPGLRVVVADCGDHACRSWLTGPLDPRVRCLVVADPEEPWNKGRFQNRALAELARTEDPGELVALLDADTQITAVGRGPVTELAADPEPPRGCWAVATRFVGKKGYDEAPGLTIASLADLLDCGGVPEWPGWGGEDIGLRARLVAGLGLPVHRLPLGSFFVEPHDGLERRGWGPLPKQVTADRNLRRLVVLVRELRAATGRDFWQLPLGEWVEGPGVRRPPRAA